MPASPRPTAAASAPVERRGLAICVVDDDDVYRDYLAHLLRSEGHRVVQARNSDELATALSDDPIDCVVLDYNLVSENGIEVYERIGRRVEKVPPVVMVTGTEHERIIIKAFRIGLDDFVLKRGLRITELTTAIERAVAKRREEDALAIELEKLKRRSAFDVVTGFYSRTEIDRKLISLAESADRRRGRFAILVVTINQIQLVTDHFGMVVGDRALRAAASRLQAVVRPEDICGRYDDATFVYAIDVEPSAELLQQLCESVDTALSFEFQQDAAYVGITATIGCAVYPRDGDVPGELVEAAAQRIFLSPRGGRATAFETPSGGNSNAPSPIAVAALPIAAPRNNFDGKTERRRHRRQRVLKRGRLIFNEGYSAIDCMIRDISESGARLRVGDEFSAPATFELLFVDTGIRRKAALRWQNGANIGVEFLPDG